jgi:heavy metal translocating P-type ATPase
MESLWTKMRRLFSPPPHGVVALFIAAGMLAAWSGPYLFLDPRSRNVLLLASIVVASLPLCADLVGQLSQRNFSVDLLAFLSVASAVLLHQYWVAAIVILMLSGGKALEEHATRRASSVLGALSRRMPQTAHLVTPDGSISDIHVEAIEIGSRLIVYPHELCPVDGRVVDGFGTMDESYLTGEPFLIAKAPGSAVISGSVNGDAAVTIEATRMARDSRYAKIVQVLHASEDRRPRIRRLGDRLGMWYTPFALAVAVASWAISADPERFLAVLVIATPCPLLLAIPIAIIGAVSTAAREGIVIKDPSTLEKLESCQTLIVDKTGTLTYGKPSLTQVICLGDWSRRFLVQMTASLERYSKHPLASAVLAAAETEGIPLLVPRNVSESPGKGLSGEIEGHSISLTGRGKLSAPFKDQLADLSDGLECIVLVDGKLGASMRFADAPRSESRPFLRHVEAHHGIQRIVLLSGDRPAEVARFAAGMGVSSIHGGKSPEEKVEIVRSLTSKGSTLYIGDGINDAPAMMNATVGIALGVNSDITSEAAGAVILQSSLASVDELIHIGSRLRRIALTSAIGGIALSMLGMAAGALGYLAPIEGAILQEGIDLLAILNALRMILPTGPLRDFKSPALDTAYAAPAAHISPMRS